MNLLIALWVAVAAPERVEFAAKDGVVVHADLWRAPAGKGAPLALLFHQMQSNAAEYDPIAPQLVDAGFNCLCPDLRGGGEKYGRKSRASQTAELGADWKAAFPLGYADMEASLAWALANGFTGPVVAWGSSYSAGLAFRLAAEHHDISAIVSLSPPPPPFVDYRFDEPPEVPALLSWPPSENERGNATFEQLTFPKKRRLEQTAGAHGSGTLRTDVNPRGADENWKGVMAFLDEFVPRKR